MKLYLKRKLLNLKKPQNIIVCILIIVLSYLVLLPLFSIVLDSLTVHTTEVLRINNVSAGEKTLYHWKRIFLSDNNKNIFFRPLYHSLITSIGACIISVVIGGFYSWLIYRTDIGCKKLIKSLFLLPYIMPSWTLALAWSNFFKNDLVGGQAGIFEGLTGIRIANSFAYGPLPISIVTGLHYAPFAYILIGAALQNMDSNLEEAAMILGCNKFTILRKITFPLVLPALFSTIILVFSSGLNAFATAQFLGLPVKYYTLTTEMYRLINGTNPGAGYVISLVMIVISIIVLYINNKLIGSRKSYTTINGKYTAIKLLSLGKFRKILTTICVIFIILISIVPLISFAIESLITIPGNYEINNFSLKYWIGKDNSITNGILVNSLVWKALFNTLLIALICSLVAGTIGFLSGYAIVKKRGSKSANVLNVLTFIPYLIPSLSFSTIYLSMFSKSNFFIPKLYGSLALLLMIGSVKYLPMASRTGINAMHQINLSLEESAEILGVPWYKRIIKIIVPLLKNNISSGYVLPFMSGMRELELFVLLYTPKSIMLTALLFQFNSKGFDQYANAITLLIVIIVIIANHIAQKIGQGSLKKETL